MKSLKRSLIVGLVAAVCSTAVFAEGLGLAERRAVDAYQKGPYVSILSSVEKAAGFKVPVEVKWELIAKPGEAGEYSNENYWTKIYFVPLEKALASITVDAMGKDALKAKLKKVVVTNVPGGSLIDVTFEGGTLTLNFRPFTNADDVDDRAAAIQKTLEKAL